MRIVFLLLSICCCRYFSNAQLSLSDTLSDQQLIITNNEKLMGYYTSGVKQFEGYKRKDDLHGQWKSWYNNSRLLDSGLLKKGIPDGEWTAWYENGNTQFIRTYSADKWQQFQNEKNLYHPKRITLPLTQLYHENKKQANKYLIAATSFCAIKNCIRANEDLQELIDHNALHQHYHPVFQHGLLHGPFANYFLDGAVKDSGNYKNGLPEGMWIKWTDDKQFYWEGHYRHGRKDQEWKLYSSSGKIIRILFFKNGNYLWRKDMKEGVETSTDETSGF